MLIDQFLPEYQIASIRRVTVQASAERVYKAVVSMDMGTSFWIRTLFRLRGIPGSSMTIEGLKKIKFSVLGEHPPEEIVLGLAGRFWTFAGDMQRIDAGRFISFSKPGYAKTAWNFSIRRTGEQQTELSTETRIYCTDQKSARKFRLYWFIIGPFSSWIRREVLKIIKTDAESGIESEI